MRLMRQFGIVSAVCVTAALLGASSAAAMGSELAVLGKVTNEGGEPLAGIEVCGSNVSIAGPWGWTSTCVTTDAAGEYTIPAGSEVFHVNAYDRSNAAPGYMPTQFPGADPVTGQISTKQIEEGIDIVMKVGAAVHGVVTAAGSAAPIPGVEVCVRPEHVYQYVGTCAHSDADGSYAIRGLEAGWEEVNFKTSGAVNYIGDSVKTEPIALGSSAEANISLEPGVRVSGVVTDALTALPPEETGNEPIMVCAARKCAALGSDGSYSIPGLAASTPFTVQFAADYVIEPFPVRFLGHDGWVGQYWECAGKETEAKVLVGEAGQSIEGIDAQLLPGEDGEAPCLEKPAGPSPSGSAGSTSPPQTKSPAPLATAPVHPKPKLKCKKGFRKASKGGHGRCVKIQKKKHRRHRHSHHPRSAHDEHRLSRLP